MNVLARERKDLGPAGDVCFRVRVGSLECFEEN